MVVLTDRIQKRLTIQTSDIANDTTAIRSLDWERDRFDIEFGLQNGTTYNSFIIRGDKLALVDTSHEKFRQLYLDTLKGLIDPSQIDWVVPHVRGLIQVRGVLTVGREEGRDGRVSWVQMQLDPEATRGMNTFEFASYLHSQQHRH